MNEVMNSWTLLWFAILNIATIALGVFFFLFEKKTDVED